ncbi:MAG: TRAP transporter TatT component family protein [Thermodesulfobacteriota bacterium]
MRFRGVFRRLAALTIIVLLAGGCLPSKKLTVISAAALLEDISRASARQSDLRIVREGMPAYLLLMDGMAEAWPDNERILLGAAQGYASFAAAFIAEEDKEYAGVLTAKSKRYALRALELRGFQNLYSKSVDDFKTGLEDIGRKDLPFLFWAASCWGSWIGLNLDSMAALADLPKVEAMMRRALALDPGFYYGGPHLFMGIWYASQPSIAGGNLARSREHFLKAREFGKGQFLMTDVYFSQYLARKAFDRDLFVATLQKVLDTPADINPDLTLLNTVARRRAQQMLEQVDDYF